jgi:hypothetical protein
VATFSDSIKLTIDVVTGTAKGSLKDLSTSVSDAEGAWGKMKAGASGALDFVQANAGAVALSAGTALAAFGAKSIKAFEDASLGAGKLRDALGLTAEQASRWQEVARDLGISTDTLATAMGRMEKVAGSTPGVFKSLGVEIARTATGAVDANGTFLNVIDRLHNMKDPAERAAAAQKLLGKSWQESSELIQLGAAGVAARLKDVEDAKVFTDDQINRGRKFRDAMDNLHDKLDDVEITIGEQLVPSLTKLATTTAELAGPLSTAYNWFNKISNLPVASQFLDIVNPVNAVSDAVGRASDVWHRFFGGGDDDAKKKADQAAALAAAVDTLKAKFEEVKKAATEAALSPILESMVGWAKASLIAKAAVDEATAAAKANRDAIAAVVGALRDEAKAQQDEIDSMQNAADATIAATDAQAKFAEAAAKSVATNKDSKATSEDKAQAVNDERDAMINAAKAQETLADSNAKAAGTTVSATGRIDSFNSSLLSNAHFATPAARDAIADYIIKANAVPASKSTAIIAAIQAGDFETAKRLLDEASRARTVAMKADADTRQANAELDAVANKQRIATIQATVTGASAASSLLSQIRTPAHAAGGVIGPNEPVSLVGERGPELVSLPAGSRVHTAAESASMLANRAGGGNTYNVAFVSSGDLAKDFAAYQRWQWRQNAQPRKAS